MYVKDITYTHIAISSAQQVYGDKRETIIVGRRCAEKRSEQIDRKRRVVVAGDPDTTSVQQSPRSLKARYLASSLIDHTWRC